MNLTVEALAELFRQSAFISALVSGFSFAFLGVVLTTSSTKKSVDWTAGFSIPATAGLLICALGWTFAATSIAFSPAGSATSSSAEIPQHLVALHRSLSMVFLVCFFLFLTSLGISGWIRSRRLGLLSSVVSGMAAVFAVWVIKGFVH